MRNSPQRQSLQKYPIGTSLLRLDFIQIKPNEITHIVQRQLCVKRSLTMASLSIKVKQMETIKFVHCSDLHIDSPFVGVSDINPELAHILNRATYDSYANIVDLAITEKVDCVLIVGDIYDSENKSLQAQLKFREGLIRLSGNGIPAYVVYGNHDPLCGWSAKLDYPENVFIFGGDDVDYKPLERNGEQIAQICGISFAKGAIYDNLALKFKRTNDPVPHIGLLHSNVGSNVLHAPYAPCSIAELSGVGMDYWALGHIHNHSVLKKGEPTIVYPGCSQSRNVRETGEKGCYLVTLYPKIEPDLKFIPTDLVRYASCDTDISGVNSIDKVISAINLKAEELSRQADKRHVVIRMRMIGRTNQNTELRKQEVVDNILEHVRSILEDREPRIWLEKLMINTAGVYDLGELKKGENFISDVISIFESLESGDKTLLNDLNTEIDSLFSSGVGYKYLESFSADELLDLITIAKNQTLDKIVRTE